MKKTIRFVVFRTHLVWLRCEFKHFTNLQTLLLIRLASEKKNLFKETSIPVLIGFKWLLWCWLLCQVMFALGHKWPKQKTLCVKLSCKSKSSANIVLSSSSRSSSLKIYYDYLFIFFLYKMVSLFDIDHIFDVYSFSIVQNDAIFFSSFIFFKQFFTRHDGFCVIAYTHIYIWPADISVITHRIVQVMSRVSSK